MLLTTNMPENFIDVENAFDRSKTSVDALMILYLAQKNIMLDAGVSTLRQYEERNTFLYGYKYAERVAHMNGRVNPSDPAYNGDKVQIAWYFLPLIRTEITALTRKWDKTKIDALWSADTREWVVGDWKNPLGLSKSSTY